MPITLNGDTGITTPGLINTGSTTLINLTTTGNTILGDASTDTLNVANGNLVLNSSGNLLVGTASGTQRLTVNSNMDVTNGTITTRLSQASGAALIGTSTNHAFFFMTNDTERMRLDTSGNLGIGTSSPKSRLTLGGSSASQQLVFDNTGSNSGSRLAMNIGYSTAALSNTVYQLIQAQTGLSGFDNQTNLSFWTCNGTTPVQNMTLDANGVLLVGRTVTPSTAGVRAALSSTGDTALQITKEGVVAARLMSVSTALAFGVDLADGVTERARITSAGDFLVGGTSVGATDSGAPQINLISSVTASQWTGRIVARNTGNNTAAFLGNYKGSAGTIAGVFGHNGSLSAWAPLYVNTVDGTAANCGDVIMGNKLLVNCTSSSFISTWGVVAMGQSAALVGPADSNAILCANAYFDGSWKRVSTGVGNILEMTYASTNIQFFTSGSSSANSAISFTSGPYIANGSNTWTNGSDARLKNITGEIQNGLAKVMTLRAAEFTWKHDADNKPCVGLIAQDVQAVLPEAVDESSYIRDDETKYLGVNYDQTIPLLVAAIQELKAELDSVKSEQATIKGAA